MPKCFIYDVSQIRLQGSVTPSLESRNGTAGSKTPLHLVNTQPLPLTTSSKSSRYCFNSAERSHIAGKAGSSSRYRYESREDDEADEDYECGEIG